jgi:hypothetical protein
MWRGHELNGRGTYKDPWKRITKFANEIVSKLLVRFPKQDFLDALDIFDPSQWKAARESVSGVF